MAKVDTIELNVKGKVHTYNINVGKAGLFKCKIDVMVAKTIGLDNNSFEYTNLKDLKNAILIPYQEFLEATSIEEQFIAIRYKSGGEYACDKHGNRLFPYNDYTYNASQFASDLDSLRFEFGVYIKETSSTGNVIWYETRKGLGCVNFNEGDLTNPNTYYKYRQAFNVSGKLIPYSDAAYQTLEKAREGIRSISEILYNVISQNEKAIESILLGGKLLQ